MNGRLLFEKMLSDINGNWGGVNLKTLHLKKKEKKTFLSALHFQSRKLTPKATPTGTKTVDEDF